MPRTISWQVLLLAAALLPHALAAAQSPVDADLLLEGGLVFDGSSSDGQIGDVAIRDKKIVAVGAFPRGNIGQVLDCRGLIVAPGFIDLHSHSDRGIDGPQGRANINFLTQGCTTVVTGNCGSGPIDVKAYFQRIDAAGAGTNVIHLIPHGALRSKVLDTSRRPPSEEELGRMRELAETAMRDGAWGMSTGLIYVPGTYASTDELAALAEVVARHGGVYASHIRNEGTELLDAVREALEIGRRAGVPVHISHYKASGRSAWGSVRAASKLIEEARAAGQRVTADQYPYTASSTSLQAMVVPTWAREGGQKALVARLDDPEQGRQLRDEIAEKLQERTRLVIAAYRPRPDWVGKSIDEIAAAEQRSQLDVVVEIERQGGASAISFGMNEEDVRFVMQLPWVATASDGSARIPDADRPHPRSFGTFPRKIGRYALDEQVISLAHAIRSASGLPADILGLADRGYLRAGMAADVVVFDPAQFRDHATFDEPYRYSTGVRYVFVNGLPAIYEGTPTGALAGRSLRPSPSSSEERPAE